MSTVAVRLASDAPKLALSRASPEGQDIQERSAETSEDVLEKINGIGEEMLFKQVLFKQ
jgi:hypothetical protein